MKNYGRIVGKAQELDCAGRRRGRRSRNPVFLLGSQCSPPPSPPSEMTFSTPTLLPRIVP